MNDTKLTVAAFESKFDNNVRATNKGTWASFANTFMKAMAHGCEEVDSKDRLPGIILGDWKTENVEKSKLGFTRRTASNFVALHALTLDIEQRPGQPAISYEAIRAHLSGIEHIGYTTFSHNLPGKGERYRVLLPLKTPLPIEYLPRLASQRKGEAESWYGALPELFPFVDHKAVWKDLQIAYLPGMPDPSLFRVWHEAGELFDWETLEQLPEPEPYVRTVRTSSKDFNGPAVLSTLDLFQWFDDFGLIKGNPQFGDRVVQVSCFNAHEHSDGSDKGAALLFNAEEESYGFHCQHAHCSHLSGHNAKLKVKELDPNWGQYCERAPSRNSPLTIIQELKRLKDKP